MRCYHCDAAVPPGIDIDVVIDGRRRPMCCAGCAAVAELIGTQGLERFYEFRQAPGRQPTDATDAPWRFCDRPDVERRITTRSDRGCELVCHVGGVNCAACAWLIDRGLRALAGVETVSVNPLTGEARIRFDRNAVKPSDVLERITRLGFDPRPAVPGASERSRLAAERAALKRLAVAGLGCAQVMTLSAALYLGAFKSMQAQFETFFVLVSLLVATPVVLYAGAPIFRGAWAAAARGRVAMDVPVSLAILIALGASLVNALRGEGPVYFDTATMFVFFLTLGRFLEQRARHKAAQVASAIAELTPLRATRRRGDVLDQVGTLELGVGDRVVVAPGEAVPADGELVTAGGCFDESLLSGESRGRRRVPGDGILGGSLSLGAEPVEIVVTRVGADSYVERVRTLLQRAMADRPDFLCLADRWAGGFTIALLIATLVTGTIWLQLAPERALTVVLAMLVVTCPCALSLAAPTAFAVALASLARRGVLFRSARALERIGDVERWLFDKTGTVTEGRLGVAKVEPLGDLDAEHCLRIAAALEAGIEHPIARALRGTFSVAPADHVELRPGYGVSGCVDGRRFRLGSARHIGAVPVDSPADSVYLASDAQLLARIECFDSVRPHAREAIEALRRSGATVVLVSGDSEPAVVAIATRLGVEHHHAHCDPAEKLALLREQQAGGAVVAAVGDGINDAPLLARADVSIAMTSGSRLAQSAADVMLTTHDLRVLARLPEWGRATRRNVRQGLTWAALYNLAAIPLAATGQIAPWMAALGMSLSSLIVVGNALRLGRIIADRPDRSRAPAHRVRQLEDAR